DFDPIDPIQYIEAKEATNLLPYPLSNGRNVINSLTATRRLTRNGIIEECCMKSCTYNEMRAYCSTPTK
ncbi:Ilp2, partial [Drosophila busckii]